LSRIFLVPTAPKAHFVRQGAVSKKILDNRSQGT
jgi:hypothetical protein